MKQIIFLLGLVVLSLYNYSKADFDWDLPAYMGCVLKKNNDITPQNLHQQVYDELKERLPEKYYLHVTGIGTNNIYRNFVSKNANAYYQQLSYYDIKELYIDVIYLINLLVKDLITSIYLLNALCFILFGFFVFTILSKYCRIGPLPSYLISLSVCALPFISNLARIASPDLMALVLVVFLCCFFIRKTEIYYQILITLVIICTRPDYLLFTTSYLALVFFIEKKRNYLALFIGLFCNISLYLFILDWYNYPGWDDLFYDTFIYRRLIISEETFILEYKDYWKVLFTSFINFKKVILTSIILLFVSFFFFKQKKLERDNLFLILLMFFSLYLKFLFFPAAGETRFFMVYLLMMGVFILNPKKPSGLQTI